jgi:hypothetical protein
MVFIVCMPERQASLASLIGTSIRPKCSMDPSITHKLDVAGVSPDWDAQPMG